MENYFIAYTTKVNGTPFYFVKHYLTFPEYKDVPDILESYGMHTDFNRACAIALVDDQLVKEQLFNDIKQLPENNTVVPIHVAKVFTLYNNKPEYKNTQ